MAAGEVQPQSAPRETNSSRPVSPAASPITPGTSRRPGERSVSVGTMNRTAMKPITPSPNDSQNSMCQSNDSAMYAATGMPMAPPTPMVALMKATAVPRRAGRSTSRMMAMPSGITPVVSPCSPRPMIIPTIDCDSAATSEPIISATSSAKMMRRLPYISPSRPEMGVATAATSRVIVTTQVVSSRGASSSTGSSACSGTTSVNMNAELRPAKASAATIAHPGMRRVRPLRDPVE